MVSSPCVNDQDIGPLRNCGFTLIDDRRTCTPGEQVSLTCTGASPEQPTAIRICETSAVLTDAMDCSHNEALGLAIADGEATIDFTCPEARDATEPGGEVAVFVAPAWDPDGVADIVCD